MPIVTTTISNDSKSNLQSGFMPTFLVIGAQKCGTTALYHYLNQHPQIYMSPVKEPNFFAFENKSIHLRDAGGQSSPIENTSITDVITYQELFRNWGDEKVAGEASPHYLYLPGTARNIKKHVPNVKLIAILRNPTERAYSAYLHARLANREPLADFRAALDAEDHRIESGYGYIYHYKNIGLYYNQLKIYYDDFDRSQLKIILYDDLKDNSIDCCQKIFAFLGVDDSFEPRTSIRYNVAGVPKSRLMHAVLQHISSSKIARAVAKSSIIPEQKFIDVYARVVRYNVSKPNLSTSDRRYVDTMFKDDIMKLQDLIDRDLSSWLVPVHS